MPPTDPTEQTGAGYLDPASLPILARALAHLAAGFQELPAAAGVTAAGADAAAAMATPPGAATADTSPPDPAALERVLLEAAERLRDNYPYFHPLYAGQMLKPPHAVARLAYALALLDQPEQPRARRRTRQLRHGEGGGRRAGAHGRLGRRTSAISPAAAPWRTSRRSGWRVELKPGGVVLASEQAHYTHGRISGVLGLPFESRARGRPRAHGPARR